MPSCFVPGCNSIFFQESKGIQFFSFPTRRPEHCELWSKAVGQENWKYSKWSKICSLHFTNDDYISYPGPVKFLKHTAVPNQMLPTRKDSGTENLRNNATIVEAKPKTRRKPRAIVSPSKPIEPSKFQPKPRPIALIKVLHQVPNPTEAKNSENEEILPHDVTNPIIPKNTIEKSETTEIPPEKIPLQPQNKEETEIETISTPSDPPTPIIPITPLRIVQKSSQKITKIPPTSKKIKLIKISPQRISKISANAKKINIVKMLPLNVSENLANSEKKQLIFSVPNPTSENVIKKNVPPLKLFGQKSPNSTNRKKNKTLLRVLPNPIPVVVASPKKSEPVKIILHKVGNEKKLEPVKILPKLVPIEDDKLESDVGTMENCERVNSTHHTMKILPVQDSNPIVAIRCPLSNQETYMPFPVEYLAKINNNETDGKSRENREINESTQVAILKREVVKLNQTIIRQKKRIQYILQLRDKRGQKCYNDES